MTGWRESGDSVRRHVPAGQDRTGADEARDGEGPHLEDHTMRQGDHGAEGDRKQGTLGDDTGMPATLTYG